MANRQNTILIVDDSEMNRSLLADILSEEYQVLEADNGRKAVELLERRSGEIALVLLDIVMPEMDGFQVLAVMNEKGWLGGIPVITISAETSPAYIDHAYDLGATDYISRPFDLRTVLRRVRNAIMLYAKQKMLEGLVTEQIVEREKSTFLMVEILSNIVEFRNGESGLHVLHIRTLTQILLRRLAELTEAYHLTPDRMALIVNASALHDVGKISIPEEILNKPGKLTAGEFETMKTHSAIGAGIMRDALQRHQEELLQVAHNICRWHHERYDGRGYPDGLTGEDIPIEAQVVALADVYDALTSVRVYKPAYSHEEAMGMILNGECGVFNPLLLRCLNEVGPRLKEEIGARGSDGVSEAGALEITNRLIADGKVSDRTLSLLEQERTKYQFFASMSNEIQFEYSVQSGLLTMSEWGAEQLGLDMIIDHPGTNPALHRVFSQEDYLDLVRQLRSATQESPIVKGTYCLHVRGEERWYKAVARPLWDGQEPPRYVGAIGKFVDFHEEQLRLERLKRMAEQDALTGLSNHPSARRMAEAALAQRDKSFALALIDLDCFREANARHGHLFGDQVLRHVAGALRGSIRSGDIAARIGGDEFLLFMEYRGDIRPVLLRLFETLGGAYEGYPVTLSLGAARAPEDGAGYEELFQAAERALYAAKRAGGNRCAFYDPSMRERRSLLSPMDN